jgi:cyclopropane fatty-acyl-phospholipid synthase-like methyltransferase
MAWPLADAAADTFDLETADWPEMPYRGSKEMFEKKVQEIFYKKARVPEDLPWHSAEPAKLLVDAVTRQARPGRALDLGCGTGAFSVFLAKHGYQVTGLDFIPKALTMAQERAKSENVELSLVLADLLEWGSDQRFDLILDSGCLHTIRASQMQMYKRKLLEWMAPNSDFILAHWGKRHRWDWRPVGPRRRTRNDLVRFLVPELEEKAHTEEVLLKIPLPIGPSVLGQCFWFQRSRTTAQSHSS